MKDLAQVLADARGELPVLRKHGQQALAEAIETLCDEITESARDWLEWLPEKVAVVRSGYKPAFLQARFPMWEREGHARELRRGERQYRACVIPRRLSSPDAAERGRRAAQQVKDVRKAS